MGRGYPEREQPSSTLKEASNSLEVREPVSNMLVCAAAMALVSSLICLFLHYEVLRFLTYILPSLRLKPRQKILVVVTSAITAHLLESLAFAVAFWLFFELAYPARVAEMSFVQALYLSIESYASLGTTAGLPADELRLLAGIEALVGLTLVGWTASFTHLAMNALWTEHLVPPSTAQAACRFPNLNLTNDKPRK